MAVNFQKFFSWRTQLTFLALSKPFHLPELGQNITAFYIITTNQICCTQAPSMSFFSLKTVGVRGCWMGNVYHELTTLPSSPSFNFL